MTALSLLDNAVLLSSDSDAAAPRQTQTDNDASGGPCGT